MLFLTALLALSSASAQAQRTVFAIVIGNNHSLNGRRPDLHYADDDAAKYYDIFQTMAPGRVTLLADFDPDSTRLYPAAREHARRPTRAALVELGRKLVDQVHAATASGETDLYFVFAGHGDVDQAVGYLELADARFTAHDLELFLRAIPFTRAHVILDSCNSFFMLAARKPGGRYYATPADAENSLATRLPNVGVFLSTSAEGDAFEWSELQSGVFSHIVRSGLLGAADADANGTIDYIELAAFVATATSEVVNPNMRPHVFARGPGGRDETPIAWLLDRSDARALELFDAASARVRVRDRQGVPLLDTNIEAGQRFALQLPAAWLESAAVERTSGIDRAAPVQLASVPNEPSALSLSALPSVDARSTTRGPADIFQMLFRRPFGRHALHAYRSQLKVAPPVIYGVSRESAERMALVLGEIASAEHDNRMLNGLLMIGVGAEGAMLAGSIFAFRHRAGQASDEKASSVYGGISLASLTYGTYTLLSPWSAERIAADYRVGLAGGDYSRAFALANDHLRSVAAREARERWVRGITGAVFSLGIGALWIATEQVPTSAYERIQARLLAGLGVGIGLYTLGAALLIQSPIKRLLNMWRIDARNIPLQPSLVPLPGGAMLSVSRRY